MIRLFGFHRGLFTLIVDTIVAVLNISTVVFMVLAVVMIL
jgi:hypothetical protein